MTELDRRTSLEATGVTVGPAGCAGTVSTTGTLVTRVTGQPGDVADGKSCVIAMRGPRIGPADGGATTARDETEVTDGSATDDGD